MGWSKGSFFVLSLNKEHFRSNDEFYDRQMALIVILGFFCNDKIEIMTLFNICFIFKVAMLFVCEILILKSYF